jgi:Protein of unknown function (DUF1385)
VDVYAALARFDGARSLPRVGGMARPDGVTIVSERYWAFASTDGTLREGVMPRVPTPIRRVPLVRGLVRLSLSLSPLFRRRGIARRRDRVVLTTALLAPFAFAFLPHSAATLAGFAATTLFLAYLLRGDTLRLHGAEHRAIAAAEERRLGATWRGEAAPSRFSLRCGTNFTALVFPVAVAGERLWPFAPGALASLAVIVVSLAVSMELWTAIQAVRLRAARVFLLPGLALQRLTTREPTLEETRIALTAVASVVRRELG